jgi:hypothetical protein
MADMVSYCSLLTDEVEALQREAFVLRKKVCVCDAW